MPTELLDIIEIVRKQEEWRAKSTLNLIASENVLSPIARSLIDSDFNHRYAEGDIGHREYQGAQFIDELETIVVRLSKELFESAHVEHRAISGALSNMATYYALSKPGNHIFALEVPSGAHISFREFGTAGARGLEVHDIPFDHEKMNIDLDKFIPMIEKVEPAIITLGGSLFLFPHPVRQIKKACSTLETKIHYDGAHVLGLIAGKEFQDPLKEGADVVTGSTHKTFPGPQGALMLMNEKKVYKKVSRAIFPGLVSNHHLGRMAPLAITLLEMLEFGKVYAKQTVSNAKTLGKVVDDLGLQVLARNQGYTESHQIVIDIQECGGGKRTAVALEQAGIIANKNLIPCDDVNCVDDPSGLRLGVQEITRMGMKETEMEQVGELLASIMLKREKKEQVREKVKKLVSLFNDPQFCFKLDGEG
ncbi:serine hydroxymethyltransferase [Candidatus Bathyarchaeota archaeon]|nr:serine hydroxymethyltransferase [Candidatus Bathyarchaeota archaeon]